MYERPRADAKLIAEEWSFFFNDKLHTAPLRMNMKAQHVYKIDDSGYFRNFVVIIGKVWGAEGQDVGCTKAWVRLYPHNSNDMRGLMLPGSSSGSEKCS